MPKTNAPEPGPLARAVSAEIRAELARQRVTGQQLAGRIDRSQNYLAKRLRDEVALTLDDVETIAAALGTTYARIVTAAIEKLRNNGASS